MVGEGLSVGSLVLWFNMVCPEILFRELDLRPSCCSLSSAVFTPNGQSVCQSCTSSCHVHRHWRWPRATTTESQTVRRWSSSFTPGCRVVKSADDSVIMSAVTEDHFIDWSFSLSFSHYHRTIVKNLRHRRPLCQSRGLLPTLWHHRSPQVQLLILMSMESAEKKRFHQCMFFFSSCNLCGF